MVLLQLSEQADPIVARIRGSRPGLKSLILQADNVRVPDQPLQRLRYDFSDLVPGSIVALWVRRSKRSYTAVVMKGYGARISLRDLELQRKGSS